MDPIYLNESSQKGISITVEKKEKKDVFVLPKDKLYRVYYDLILQRTREEVWRELESC